MPRVGAGYWPPRGCIHGNFFIVSTDFQFCRILSLHGVPKTIIFDRGIQFIPRFWEHFHAALGTQFIRSSAYHPQTNGQTERINQILEDMLRASVLSYSKK